MSNVSTQTKRAMVRWALLAPQTSSSLLAVFQGLLTARVGQTRAGLILTMTAGNGHSSTYTLDPDLTPTDALGLAEELITRYEEAVAALADEGEASPTDAQIGVRILRDLGDPPRVLRNDYSRVCS